MIGVGEADKISTESITAYVRACEPNNKKDIARLLIRLIGNAATLMAATAGKDVVLQTLLDVAGVVESMEYSGPKHV